MPTQDCTHCRERFQDGEVISVGFGGRPLYHTTMDRYLPSRAAVMDCALMAAMNSGQAHVNQSTAVFYHGQFYSFGAIDRVAATTRLSVKLNSKFTAHRLDGDLRALEQEKPLEFQAIPPSAP